MNAVFRSDMACWRGTLPLMAPGKNIPLASGKCAGRSVPHLHIHIIPRKRQDGIDAWPKLNGAAQSVEAVYEKLKQNECKSCDSVKRLSALKAGKEVQI